MLIKSWPEPGECDTYDDAKEKLECIKFIFDVDDEASEFEMFNFYKDYFSIPFIHKFLSSWRPWLSKFCWIMLVLYPM